MGELGQPDRKLLKPFRKVMRSRLTLKRGVHCQDDLLYAASTDALNEVVDGEVLGSDAFQRRKATAKDVIAARKKSRTIQRPQIRNLLDHAE